MHIIEMISTAVMFYFCYLFFINYTEMRITHPTYSEGLICHRTAFDNENVCFYNNDNINLFVTIMIIIFYNSYNLEMMNS